MVSRLELQNILGMEYLSRGYDFDEIYVQYLVDKFFSGKRNEWVNGREHFMDSDVKEFCVLHGIGLSRAVEILGVV